MYVLVTLSSALQGHHAQKPIRASEGIVQQDQGKRGGIMSIVLPVYAVGIVLYLFYTLSKVRFCIFPHNLQFYISLLTAVSDAKIGLRQYQIIFCLLVCSNSAPLTQIPY